MKKQLLALGTVLALAGFATASAGVSDGVDPRSRVIHMATAVLCEGYEDGLRVREVCVEGHTGYVVQEFVDATLSAFPHSQGMRFLSR